LREDVVKDGLNYEGKEDDGWCRWWTGELERVVVMLGVAGKGGRHGPGNLAWSCKVNKQELNK
jgi:hypothetical protein